LEERLVDAAFKQYESAVNNAYGESTKLGSIAPHTLKEFLSHMRPIMLQFYQATRSEIPENILYEFLMNFGEIGAHGDRLQFKPNINLVRIFCDDASDVAQRRMVDKAKLFDTLSARKLFILKDAGIMQYEQLAPYDLKRIQEGYESPPGTSPGCFDYSLAWFKGRLGNVPDRFVNNLIAFYRGIIKPATDNIEHIRQEIETRPPPSPILYNGDNHSVHDYGEDGNNE
jgi:hypothetical protein